MAILFRLFKRSYIYWQHGVYEQISKWIFIKKPYTPTLDYLGYFESCLKHLSGWGILQRQSTSSTDFRKVPSLVARISTMSPIGLA